MTIRWGLFTIITMILILTSCSTPETSEKKIVPFLFKDQHEQSFGSKELAGSVWVANFIFTNCETVCPLMMYEMAALQKELKDRNILIELVSFSVDPEVDSSNVLKQYLKNFTDDETNWHMVTGYNQETIETFAREEFQTIVQKPNTSDQVIHGTNFYLVDQEGYILNEYNYTDGTYLDEMIEDINKIINK